MRKTPFKYQTDAIEKLSRKIAGGVRKIIFQLSTGGGKTITVAEIIRRFTAKSDKDAIFIVHRDKLRKQASKAIYEQTGQPPISITRDSRRKVKSRVYVGMVDSLKRRLPDNIGLVLIDECHVGNMRKVHEWFPDAIIIGVTATPIASSKKFPMKDQYEDIVCGPDTPELIQMGNLVQNITICPKDIVQRRELTLKNGEFDEAYMSEKFSAPRFVMNTVNAYKKHFDGKKNIVFNVNVNHSKLVNDAFLQAGYQSKHIDGTMSQIQVDAVFTWFERTSGAILNNVGIAVAGIDVPSIEVVTLNFSTTSLTKFLQTCGRGSRTCEQWKTLFGILDMGGNASEFGDWNEARDWEEIFRNPKKASDKAGVAPKKNCPYCDALIAIQALTCPYCDANLRKEQQEEVEAMLEDYIVMTKGMDLKRLIESNKRRKVYYPFFEMGRKLASVAPKDERVFDRVYEDYLKNIQLWCDHNSIKFSEFHRNLAKEHLTTLINSK
jgi:superfamily II DNA or RNA helicase